MWHKFYAWIGCFRFLSDEVIEVDVEAPQSKPPYDLSKAQEAMEESEKYILQSKNTENEPADWEETILKYVMCGQLLWKVLNQVSVSGLDGVHLRRICSVRSLRFYKMTVWRGWLTLDAETNRFWGGYPWTKVPRDLERQCRAWCGTWN